MTLYSIIAFIILVLTISEIKHLSFVILLTVCCVFTYIIMVEASTSPSLQGSLLFMLAIVVACSFTTHSLLFFFVIYEFSLLPVGLLVFIYGAQPEKLDSTVYLIVYTICCSLPLLYYSLSLNGNLWYGLTPVATKYGLLLSLSFIVKSPLYTLHSWLPKAHTEANLLGSMLLAGVILKLGGYGLMVLSSSLNETCIIYLHLTLVGGVVCSLLCFRNWDMKALVAYSSVVHMGVVTLGALRGIELGLWASTGIMVGHSLISPLMFVLAYEIYCRTGRRSLVHSHRSSISLHCLLLIGLCAGINFGLPPFLNFWVEVALFGALGYFWVHTLIPLACVALLSYLYRLTFYISTVGGRFRNQSPSLVKIYVYIPPILLSLVLPLGTGTFNIT